MQKKVLQRTCSLFFFAILTISTGCMFESLQTFQNRLRTLDTIAQSVTPEKLVPFTLEQAHKRSQELSAITFVEANRAEFIRDLPRIRDAYTQEATAALTSKDKTRLRAIKNLLTQFDTLVKEKVALESSFQYREKYKSHIKKIVESIDAQLATIEKQEFDEQKKKEPLSFEAAKELFAKLEKSPPAMLELYQKLKLIRDSILKRANELMAVKIFEPAAEPSARTTVMQLLSLIRGVFDFARMRLGDTHLFRDIIEPLIQVADDIRNKIKQETEEQIKAAAKKPDQPLTPEQAQTAAEQQKEDTEIAKALKVSMPLYTEVWGSRVLTNPQAILGFGVAELVDDKQEINKKYKVLALRWAPDKNIGGDIPLATKVFRVINDARAMLIAALPKK